SQTARRKSFLRAGGALYAAKLAKPDERLSSSAIAYAKEWRQHSPCRKEGLQYALCALRTIEKYNCSTFRYIVLTTLTRLNVQYRDACLSNVHRNSGSALLVQLVRKAPT